MKKINLQEDYKHIYEDLIGGGYIDQDEDEEVVIETIIEYLEEEDLIDIFDILLNQYQKDSFEFNNLYNGYLSDYIEFFINCFNQNTKDEVIIEEDYIDEFFDGCSIFEFINNLVKNKKNNYECYLYIDSLNHYYFYEDMDILKNVIFDIEYISDEEEARSILLDLFL